MRCSFTQYGKNYDRDKGKERESETKSNANGKEAKDNGVEDHDPTAEPDNASLEGVTVPATNLTSNDSNSLLNALAECQIQPGAVAVAGPDRDDEPDERRLATPKCILAERLQTSVERANADGRTDIVRENEVKPGAIAVPGPDADDGRNKKRVVTPKRVLAERLQHSAEREENMAIDKSDCVMEDVDETSQTERTSCENTTADCDEGESTEQIDQEEEKQKEA